MRNIRVEISKSRVKRSSGFSLVEMLVAVAILMIVIGVAVAGMVEMQRRNSAESSKVDTVQETRDFIDQMVRDIHDVGYPPGRVLNGNPTCVNNPNVSCGIVYFSPTQIRYEADIDGTGTVYQIWMQLLPPASGNCPCILQRGTISKASALAGSVPTYFTEVNGVLNSGNGVGGATYPVSMPAPGNYAAYSTADVFDAYFNDASQYVNPFTGAYSCDETLNPTSCASIRSLQIEANVTASAPDPKTNTYPVYSITSKARLNN
jgi:type II secretory pathway pseudopilin PulG